MRDRRRRWQSSSPRFERMPMRPAAAPPRRPHGARLLGKVPRHVLRAGRRDRPIAQLPPLGLRVAGLAAVAVIVFAVILFRLWFLQILTGQQYVAAANNNRLRTITVPAPRGDIVDSQGRILVDNRPALAVGLRLMDVPQGHLRDEVSRLADVPGLLPGVAARVRRPARRPRPHRPGTGRRRLRPCPRCGPRRCRASSSRPARWPTTAPSASRSTGSSSTASAPWRPCPKAGWTT